MIEVTINSLGFSPMNNQRVVLLKEQAGERYLPIWIGPAEADAIAVKLQSVDVPRPLSHDLLWSVIGTLNASIDSVVINELRDDTFYGRIILNAREGQVEIDARPSDALALAVRARAPIFAEDTILDKAGLLIDEETGQATPQETPERKRVSGDELKKLSAYTDFINTLDMEDFDKVDTVLKSEDQAVSGEDMMLSNRINECGKALMDVMV